MIAKDDGDETAMRLPAIVGVAGGLVLTLGAPARAQLAGSHTLGDYGVQAGSQPGPGFYDVVFYYRYSTDTIKDADTRLTSGGRTGRSYALRISRRLLESREPSGDQRRPMAMIPPGSAGGAPSPGLRMASPVPM